MDSNANSIIWFFKWYFSFVWKAIIMPLALIWTAMKWVFSVIGRMLNSIDGDNRGGSFFSRAMADIKNFRLKILR